MAIYSCNLASIGRTTHAPGTAGAHLRYISREGAEPVVESHAIPLDPIAARTWMDREEATARANARLCDKVRIAIPRELDETQRLDLVRDFVKDVTGDRVPWMFAIHQRGEDEHNPHAHIVLRDRDLETGKRVLRLSDNARDRTKAGLEPKAVEWIRERWETLANNALARAGHAQRIDRRTLDAQGIDRTPTIHVGPRGEEVERHVQRPNSKARTNGAGREIDYPSIDQGRTRQERNAEIVDLNLERAARSPDFETRTWAQFERQQIKLDRQLERELSAQARNRTRDARALKKEFRQRLDKLRHERQADYRDNVARQRQGLHKAATVLRTKQRAERQQLSEQQGSLWSRMKRTLDFTGGARRKQREARQEQIARHKVERSTIAARSRQQHRTLRDTIAERFNPQLDDLRTQRAQALATMKDMHQRGEASADAKRQLRERDREAERQRTAVAIRIAKARSVQSPNVAAGEADQSDRRSSLRAALERARTEPGYKVNQPNTERHTRAPSRGFER